MLGRLHRAGLSGTLELHEDAGATHRVHLRAGVIEGVETANGRRLGDVLRQLEPLGRDQRLALERCGYSGSSLPLGEQLVASGLVSADTMIRALSVQMIERLDRLFTLSRARISFRVLRQLRKGFSVTLRAEQFLQGRPRLRSRRGGSPLTRASVMPRHEAFAVLGIAPTTDPERIRRAFRLQAARVHPDRCPSSDVVAQARQTERFKLVTEAYRAVVVSTR